MRGFALALLLAATTASAWSTRVCTSNSSLQTTYPGSSVWPLVFLSNAPSGSALRTATSSAISTWNQVVGATDNVSTSGGGFGFCNKPDGAGTGVIGWDDGTCYAWGQYEVGVVVAWTTNCLLTRESVYFNSDFAFSAAQLESAALHELGHYQNAAHDWYAVSIMGYSDEPMVTLTAEDHSFLRGVWPSTNSAPPDLYIDRFVQRSPVLPGQESFVQSPPPTCSGGCSDIQSGDTVTVKLSYGNAGKQSTGHSFDITMRLGSHEIGSWTVSTMAAMTQDTYTFVATVPAGVPPGSYSLVVEIDPNGTVNQVDGPTSGDFVSFPGFAVRAPLGWTCSPSHYNALDGCDCSCGVADPDCTATSVVARGCGDSNACTDDRCSASGTCTYPNNTVTCDDTLYCTVSDRCSGGACTPGTARDCSALTSFCSTGTCDEPGRACVRTPLHETESCDDGKFCTVGDTCATGLCVGSARDCSALDDQCATGTCDEANDRCAARPARENLGCDDAKLCTVSDSCHAGTCAGRPKDCSALDTPCMRGTCDAATGGCVAVPLADGSACEDGAYCTVAETCTAGVCGGGSARSCAALDSTCATGTCSESARACLPVAKNDGLSCDDAQYCTTADVCRAGRCVGASRDCSAQSGQCTLGTCDENADACRPVAANEGRGCDDGLFCTVGDVCRAGTCDGAPRACAAAGACQTGSCDEAGGACVMSLRADGSSCDDGKWCTVGDTCSGGACAGQPRDCSGADSDCRVGRCDEVVSACVPTARPDGTACNDGSVCTLDDACTSGACFGQPFQCEPSTNQCAVNRCEESTGACVEQPVPFCEDQSGTIVCVCSTSPALGFAALAISVALRRRRRVS